MSDDLPQTLAALYSHRFPGEGDYRQRVWRVLNEAFFSRWIPAGSTVLDLGCGHCEFINQLRAARKYGMDLNPQSPEKAANEVTLLRHDCSEPWPLPEGLLDVVFSSNFFEHLPSKDRLLWTLRQAHRCLRPGGRLIAMGPNIRVVKGRYWDFFDHHLPLSERSLCEGLAASGFRILKALPRFLPFTMSHGRKPPLWLLRLYLELPLAWKLLGKQFLVMAEKP